MSIDPALLEKLYQILNDDRESFEQEIAKLEEKIN